MAAPKNEAYVYATACVKSQEKYLITQPVLEKMLDAKQVEDVLKCLYELQYGEGQAIESIRDYEVLLEGEENKLSRFIRQIAPDPSIFNLFLFTYDYHNLKTLLKSEYTGEDPDDILLDAGTIGVNALRAIVRERSFMSLTEDMRSAFTEAQEVFSKTGDPQAIDLTFDKYCFSDMKKIAGSVGNPFLTGYVETLIDLSNVKTFVRLKRMKKPWDFFQKVFVEGGRAPAKVFVQNYDAALEQFAEKMKPFGYEEVMLDGNRGLKQSDKLTELEKSCDNHLMRYIREAKYMSFGLEALVGYMVAKEQEIKLARIIISAKLADLSSDEIRERLRETYV